MSAIHVTESIPAYALGILEETERQEITLHLESCPACREELRSYQAVVQQLPMAATRRTPPKRLRAGILQAAAVQAEESRKRRPALPGWLSRPLSPLVGLVGLALIVILGAFNIFQWQQARRAPVQTVTTFSEFRLVAMIPPQPGSQNTSGVLVINQKGTLGTLVVDGLTRLDPSQQYQLWLIKDGNRTSGGVFSVFGSGYGYLYVRSPEPLASYTSFGVTIEPSGGSPGPTGEKVLGGDL